MITFYSNADRQEQYYDEHLLVGNYTSIARGNYYKVLRNWVVVWSDRSMFIIDPHSVVRFWAHNLHLADRAPHLAEHFTPAEVFQLPKSIKQFVIALLETKFHIVLSAEIEQKDASGLTTRTFGVEIECLYPSSVGSYQDLERAMAVRGIDIEYRGYTHTTSEHWKIVTDASIRVIDGYLSCEIVSPILKGREGLQKLNLVCQALDDLGCTVNKSCGFHVHHGAANMSIEARKDVFRYYRRAEGVIDTLVSPSRRGNENRFCQSLFNYSEGQFPSTRYVKVNAEAFARHGTIEFRQHQGTINYQKMSNWIRLTQAIMTYASVLRGETVGSLDIMLKQLHLEQYKEFFKERVGMLS